MQIQLMKMFNFSLSLEISFALHEVMCFNVC